MVTCMYIVGKTALLLSLLEFSYYKSLLDSVTPKSLKIACTYMYMSYIFLT